VAFTTTDLAAVNSALAKGEQTVHFADRSVTYRSVSELLQVRDLILAELPASSVSTTTRTKRVFLVASKGF
jgi:hypothetical protein